MMNHEQSLRGAIWTRPGRPSGTKTEAVSAELARILGAALVAVYEALPFISDNKCKIRVCHASGDDILHHPVLQQPKEGVGGLNNSNHVDFVLPVTLAKEEVKVESSHAFSAGPHNQQPVSSSGYKNLPSWYSLVCQFAELRFGLDRSSIVNHA
jgi:hypothetical protein